MGTIRCCAVSLLSLIVLALCISNGFCASIDSCPGYKASNVQQGSGKLTADLTLASDACDVYGTDLKDLRLLVEYQSEHRLHVKIYDAEERVYQVPESVVPRPASGFVDECDLHFDVQQEPFSFAISRKSTGEVLFDTSAAPLIFESEYLRLRTSLPADPNLYGLGENVDSLRLPTADYFHTLWNAGEPFLPHANLYGSHNVYYDHRGANGTHAVFMLSSSGMKINIDQDETGQYLEYNSLGGAIDLYFMSGANPKEASIEYAKTIGYPALMPYWGFGFHQCRYGYQDVYEVAGVVANYSEANIPLETMWTDIDYMDYRRTLSLDPARFPIDKMRRMIDHLHEHQQKYIVMVDPAVEKYEYTPFQQGQTADVFLKQQNDSLYTGVVWAGASVFPDWFDDNTQAYWDEQFGRFFNADTGVDIDGLWIDMNEASNFCDYPCPNPMLDAIQNQNPPRPPPARMHSPYEIPGFPSTFQPSCVAYVTFNVNARVNATKELLLLMGDAPAIGGNVPHDSPQLYPYDTSPPVYNLTVQLSANTKVTYQYVRYIYSVDGEYVLEKQSRTLQTSDCNSLDSPQQVHDTLDNSDGNDLLVDRGISQIKARLEIRQEPPADRPGSMQGLPGRELINPAYNISNYIPWDNLSVQTIPTNIYHSNGLVELDVHNLYGTMMSTASRNAMISRRPGRRPLIITRSTFAGAGRHVGHWFGDNISEWEDYRISIRQMIEFAAFFQLPMVGSDICGFNYNTTAHLCARWATLGAYYPFMRNHAEYHTISQEFYRWPLVADAARNALDTRYRLLDYLYTAMYRQNQTGTPTISPLFFMYPEDTNTFDIQQQFFFGDSILVSPVLEPNQTSVTAYMPNDLFYDFNTHQAVQGQEAMMTFTNVAYTEITTHIRGGSIIPMRVRSANTTTEVRKQNFVVIVAPGLNGTAAGSLYLDDGESLVQNAISDIQFTYSASGVFSMGGSFAYDSGVVIEAVTVLGVDADRRRSESSAVYDSTAKSLTQQVNMPLTEAAKLSLL